MTVNANRFIAPAINISTLPAPNAIEPLDVEGLLDERMVDFTARAAEAGFDYDVGSLETDPIKIDQRTHAYREMLVRGRVNDGIRAVLPAYAGGSDLDAIAARANVERLILVPADEQTGAAAVMESDASLLLRYLTSFAVPSAGSPDGYIFHSVMAWPYARDIAVAGPGVHGVPGRAAIYLLAEAGGAVSNDAIDAVRDRLFEENVKPLTDEVIVQAAQVLTYQIELVLTVPRGPAPAAVRAAALAAVRKLADARYAIGVDVWANAIEGAAYVGNVTRVQRISPAADIHPGPTRAAYCTAVTITVEVEET